MALFLPNYFLGYLGHHRNSRSAVLFGSCHAPNLCKWAFENPAGQPANLRLPLPTQWATSGAAFHPILVAVADILKVMTVSRPRTFWTSQAALSMFKVSRWKWAVLVMCTDASSILVRAHKRFEDDSQFYLLTTHLSFSKVAVKAFRFVMALEGVDKLAKVVVSARLAYRVLVASQIVRRELRVWRKLSHENVVPFLGVAHGFGLRNSTSLVSLWMPNGTLQSFIANHDNRLIATHRLHLVRHVDMQLL